MIILTSAEFEGRPSGAQSPHRSAYYIMRQFEKLELDVKLSSFEFKRGFFETGTGHNIVATKPCTLEQCQPAIIFTAHYDHLGGNGYRHYPGANDNATGVAVMMDIARRLNNVEFERDLVFVATDAEEKGLHGAKHFVSQLGKVPVSMNINLDMLNIQKRNTLYALASRDFKPMQEQIESHFGTQCVRLNLYFSSKRMARRLNAPQIDWLRASDHYPFHRAKIPFIYFGSGVDKHHHSMDDSLDKINLEKLSQVSQSITGLVRSLATTSVSDTS
ncbi:M20/M25/M40 family metallo-hydrolase [Pseudoalteromonas luteoviolacea]|nr:M20/M25/M40 family metallo-hydrolase [Pseudoalteromonas luteoviolacea]